MKHRLRLGLVLCLLGATSSLLPAVSGPGAKPRVDAQGDPLPPGAIARLGTIRLKHIGDVQAVAFSADGKHLASAGGDLGIRLWDLSTGHNQRTLEGHTAPVRALAFSRNEKGPILISASQDGTIRFWNADDGAELPTQIEHPGPVAVMSVSADGKTIATGATAEDGSYIYLWNTADGKEIRRWKAHAGPIMALAFSADGKLASGGTPRTGDENEEGKDEAALILWNPAKGEKLHAYPEHTEQVRGLAFSPDGKLLASTGIDKNKGRSVRLWDATGPKEIRQLKNIRQNDVDASCLAFSPDGKTLAAAEARILLWDLEKETPPKTISHVHRPQVNALAFSADSSILASAGPEGGVGVWDVVKRAPRFVFDAHLQPVTSVAVSADGKTIATGSSDATARLWDKGTGKMLRVLKQPPAPGNPLLGPSIVWCVTFTPDGKTLALAHENGQITFWDPRTGKMTGHIGEVFIRITSISFSPDGKWLLTNSFDDFEVYLREASTGKEIRTYSRGENRGATAALSPDGRFVVSPARGLLFLWDTDTGKLLYEKEKAGLAVAFCPASLLLATAGQEIHILDAATGTDLGQLEGRTGKFGLKALAFSHDGLLLAVAEEDRVSLWDVATRQPVREFFGHRGALTSVAFSADGQTFVTSSEDGTALVWDVTGVVSPKKLAPVKALEMPALWSMLKDGDRLRGYPAYLRMRLSPGPVTEFLAKQLQPILPASLAKIPKLIEDLDSTAVSLRNKATEELEKLGDAAEKPLREALKKSGSLETGQRIEKLLEKMGNSPETIRQHWALRLLEEFKTPEARKFLEHLAAGTPLSRLTREAQASLKRSFGSR